MLTIEAVNEMEGDEFVRVFGSVIEHSPWVAENISFKRPFSDRAELHQAMKKEVLAAPKTEWLQILRAHPELSGQEAVEGKLTEASSKEQARLGLDRLPPDEFVRMREFNIMYFRKFSFPCIIAVGLVPTREALYEIQERRIGQSFQDEVSTALNQVFEIAKLRLESMIEEGKAS